MCWLYWKLLNYYQSLIVFYFGKKNINQLLQLRCSPMLTVFNIVLVIASHLIILLSPYVFPSWCGGTVFLKCRQIPRGIEVKELFYYYLWNSLLIYIVSWCNYIGEVTCTKMVGSDNNGVTSESRARFCKMYNTLSVTRCTSGITSTHSVCRRHGWGGGDFLAARGGEANFVTWHLGNLVLPSQCYSIWGTPHQKLNFGLFGTAQTEIHPPSFINFVETAILTIDNDDYLI